MAGVQSWPKCWLSGSCPRAQCQRWWTLNICHSVVSCLILKTKVSLKRRCFQQCPELENLIKYDAGWYIFFVAMLNWIAASPVQKENRWTTDTGLELVAGHLFKLLQIREAPWNDCCSHMAIQEQSWRPKESPEAAKLSLFHFQFCAGFVIETWPRPCKKAMWWCQEVKLNWPVLNCVVLERHSYRYL